MSFLEIANLLGNLGEFVGTIAVVMTLVYVVFQLRINNEEIQLNRIAWEENNRLSRVRSLASHAESMSNWRARISTNQNVASIFLKASDGIDTLEKVERLQFHMLVMELFNLTRVSYEAADAVGEEFQKAAVAANLSQLIARHKGMSTTWHSSEKSSREVSPEFYNDIEKRLEQKASG